MERRVDSAAPRIHRLGTVSSTQDEAARRLTAGELPPFALSAQRQTAGRGRLGREFASPEGASLSLTYVHRTALEPAQRGWFPLAAGLAAVTALTGVLGERTDTPEGVRIGLKWPNDLHTEDGRKLGGILVEGRGAEAVLLGIGLNLRGPIQQADGSAVPGAAWLCGEGGIRSGAQQVDLQQVDVLREGLEDALVAALTAELTALESTGGDGVSAGTHERYTMTCLTFGHAVRVDPLGMAGAGGASLPPLHGVARAVDRHGRLLVDPPGGEQVAVDVGDVRHLRPDPQVRTTTHDAMGVEQEEQCT